MNTKRRKVLGVVIICLIIAGLAYVDSGAFATTWLENVERIRTPTMLLLVSAIYIVCLALPFMPGVELGLVLMVVFGQAGIIAACVSTIAALNLSFAVGRLLGTQQIGDNDPSWMRSALDRSAVGRRLLLRFGYPLLNHRYLALGILFNLPGNWVLGGGGGIALASGFSRSFSWPKFLFTVAMATCPVPILAYLGIVNVEAALKAMLQG